MSDADDREAVDRAFAELVAGYHLTADRPDPPAWDRPATEALPEPGSKFEPPRPAPELDLPGIEHSPTYPPAIDRSGIDRPEIDRPGIDRPGIDLPGSGLPRPQPVDEPAQQPEERFDPGPPPPLPRPAGPVLIGWIGLGYAILTMLAIAVGFDLPTWAAWAGVIGFVGGFGLLVSRLPRQRPPDAGDGAVL